MPNTSSIMVLYQQKVGLHTLHLNLAKNIRLIVLFLNNNLIISVVAAEVFNPNTAEPQQTQQSLLQQRFVLQRNVVFIYCDQLLFQADPAWPP